ncbi:hypothetical protein ACFORG_15665 [Lutimaribacter marinistellae]|uniref:Lipoprotein n=1 Tax=Lutimaribacter marinistellae TaxID=1820329 RepID=A0ABV7THV8_9RHOB
MIDRRTFTFGLLALAPLAGCSSTAEVTRAAVSEPSIDGLTRALIALDPSVAPEEAARAARISHEYAADLRVKYQVTDPPLVHNYKVNSGMRPRGICVHWADDIESRLRQERFRTLYIHRAISPPRTSFHISHSAPILSARGQTMFEGIVIDGWREGGNLVWAPVSNDPDYNWRPRAEVLGKIAERRAEQQARLTE